MPFDVQETTLPGVGKKYELYLDENRCIAIIIESSGPRRLHYREHEDDDFEEILSLTDSQARTLGLFLVGAYYQPIAAEVPEETEAGEHIEWYSVTSESPLVETPIDAIGFEELGTVLLGIEHEGRVISAPDPDFTLSAGDRLIVCATDDGHEALQGQLQS